MSSPRVSRGCPTAATTTSASLTIADRSAVREWQYVTVACLASRSIPAGLPRITTTAELIGTLADLSGDPEVHGILLQHPCGPHINERAAFEAIASEKDVDGVTMHSFAAISFAFPGFVSCTGGGQTDMPGIDTCLRAPRSFHGAVRGRRGVIPHQHRRQAGTGPRTS